MARQIIETRTSVIVYDDTNVRDIKAPMFDAIYWRDRASASGQQGGRGSVLFVSRDEGDWVIRHYYRGGMVGKVLTDQFLWSGQEKTRSFREWHLLQRLQAEGLPAPAPVAARYQRRGLFYTADLITERLPEVESFAALYLQGRLGIDDWQAAGACIATFHGKGFCHADLNAWNIQVGADGKVWILDWDRGRRLHPGKWQQSNLARLRRSLDKISGQNGKTLAESEWDALTAGYQV